MLIPISFASFIVIMLLPLAAGFWIAKRSGIAFSDFRKLFTAGALTFIGAQALHVPLVYGLTALFQNGILPGPAEDMTLIFNAVVLGLLAGLFEEPARYILFKTIRKANDSWQNGLIIGLGHGGIEAILLGILSIATVVQMMALRGVADYSTLGLPAEQVELVKAQVDAFWAQPEVNPLFAIMERIAALSLHMGLSIIVLYGVVTTQRKWLWIAILWHALVDAGAVFLAPKIGVSNNVVAMTFWFEMLLIAAGVGTLIYAWGLSSKFPVEKEADKI